MEKSTSSIASESAGGTVRELHHPDTTLNEKAFENVLNNFERHWAFPILNSCSPVPLPQKRQMITLFHDENVEDLFHPSLICSLKSQASLIFASLKALDKKMIQKLPQRACAAVLVRIFLLIGKNDEFVKNTSREDDSETTTNSGLRLAVSQLREMFKKCKAVHEAKSLCVPDAMTSLSSTASIKPFHSACGAGKRNPPQFRRQFDHEEAKKEPPCPRCNLKTLNALESAESIKQRNEVLNKDHDTRLQEWVDSGKIGPKPRKYGTVIQTMMCYGFLLHCGDGINPDGCPLCKDYAERNGGFPQSLYDGCKRICPCAWCQSKCSEVFRRNKWKQVADRVKQERECAEASLPGATEDGSHFPNDGHQVFQSLYSEKVPDTADAGGYNSVTPLGDFARRGQAMPTIDLTATGESSITLQGQKKLATHQFQGGFPRDPPMTGHPNSVNHWGTQQAAAIPHARGNEMEPQHSQKQAAKHRIYARAKADGAPEEANGTPRGQKRPNEGYLSGLTSPIVGNNQNADSNTADKTTPVTQRLSRARHWIWNESEKLEITDSALSTKLLKTAFKMCEDGQNNPTLRAVVQDSIDMQWNTPKVARILSEYYDKST